jgi:hypothetical protein
MHSNLLACKVSKLALKHAKVCSNCMPNFKSNAGKIYHPKLCAPSTLKPFIKTKKRQYIALEDATRTSQKVTGNKKLSKKTCCARKISTFGVFFQAGVRPREHGVVVYGKKVALPSGI